MRTKRTVLARVNLLVLGLLTFCLAACDGSPTAPGARSPYDGHWTGTTSQGLPISFVVSGNRVISISASYLLYPDPPCMGDPEPGSVSVMIPNPLLISSYGAGNGTNVPGFKSDGLLTETGVLGVTGSFGSNITGDGDVGFSPNFSGLIGGRCTEHASATWTATKDS